MPVFFSSVADEFTEYEKKYDQIQINAICRVTLFMPSLCMPSLYCGSELETTAMYISCKYYNFWSIVTLCKRRVVPRFKFNLFIFAILHL